MFGKTVEEEARKLALYSGEVAGARAETEIRELQATLRRTERIGPDVAKWESMRGQFAEKSMDVQTELLNVALKFANTFEPMARLSLQALEKLASGVEVAAPAIGVGLQAMLPLPTLVNIAARLLKIKEDEKDKDGFGWDDFNQILPTRQAQNPNPQAPRAPRRPLRPNIP